MNEVLAMLNEIGIPFVYSHWAPGEVPDTPYICYCGTYSNPFGADGEIYKDFLNISIELYTEIKDLESEKKIRAVLDTHGIFYSRTETWIPDEELYDVLFEFEIMEDDD